MISMWSTFCAKPVSLSPLAMHTGGAPCTFSRTFAVGAWCRCRVLHAAALTPWGLPRGHAGVDAVSPEAQAAEGTSFRGIDVIIDSGEKKSSRPIKSRSPAPMPRASRCSPGRRR